jgi:hypothetical protein
MPLNVRADYKGDSDVAFFITERAAGACASSLNFFTLGKANAFLSLYTEKR